MSSLKRSKISGTGHYVPDQIIKNEDLAKMFPTSDEWIRQRSGIEERRWAPLGTKNTDLGLEASKRALEDAKISTNDIDLIIYATLSPDYEFPGCGCILASKLGIPGIPAFDIRQQCSGFIYGLSMANSFIASGQYKKILFVCSEIHSNGLDKSEQGRDIAVLFGDGAAALVLESSESADSGFLHAELHSDGTYATELFVEMPCSYVEGRISEVHIREGRHFPKMNGRRVFQHAVTKMPEVLLSVLRETNLKVSDIDLLIPHQANLRINQTVAQGLGIDDSKVYNNIQKYGNTTAATIPLALDEARKAGRIQDGDLLAFVAFGAGFTWAAALMRM